MIKDIYVAIDEPSKNSIELVQELIESDCLMAGLGENCGQYPITSQFPVITDMDRSVYLLTSQQMWTEPEETRQDQFFLHLWDGGVDPYVRYEKEKEELSRREVAVRGKNWDNSDKLYEYLDPVFAKIIEKHKIIDYQLALNAHIKEKDRKVITHVVDAVYADAAKWFVLHTIEAGFYGGLETWPMMHHFYQCLLTGGIPSGWVGPLPENGGDHEKCVQLLHFGPQVKT